MKKNGKRFLASLLIVSLLMTARPFARSCFGASEPLPPPAPSASEAAGKVCFTVSEADSILTQLQLLQIDLDECRSVAALDSAAAAARLRAEHQPWYEKALRHPLVWFAIGAYTAIQMEKL
jgi:hypothetical protein